MSFSAELPKELIILARSIRGYVTEARKITSPRKSWIAQRLLGDNVRYVLDRPQEEINSAFRDLESLIAVTLPYLLDPSNFRYSANAARVARDIGQKYPNTLATSYISSVDQSLGEVETVLQSIQDHGIYAANNWLAVNNLNPNVDQLDSTVAVFAPLTTDYIVAALYLQTLGRESNDFPVLFPVGWMAGTEGIAVSTPAQKTLSQHTDQKILVMVDKNVTGLTTGSIHDELAKLFPNRKIHSSDRPIRD